jgi:hypothetical protein
MLQDPWFLSQLLLIFSTLLTSCWPHLTRPKNLCCHDRDDDLCLALHDVSKLWCHDRADLWLTSGWPCMTFLNFAVMTGLTSRWPHGPPTSLHTLRFPAKIFPHWYTREHASIVSTDIATMWAEHFLCGIYLLYRSGLSQKGHNIYRGMYWHIGLVIVFYK